MSTIWVFTRGTHPLVLPVKLVYSNRFTNVNDTINAEKQIKGWCRTKKEALIIGDYDLLKLLSRRKVVK